MSLSAVCMEEFTRRLFLLSVRTRCSSRLSTCRLVQAIYVAGAKTFSCFRRSYVSSHPTMHLWCSLISSWSSSDFITSPAVVYCVSAPWLSLSRPACVVSGCTVHVCNIRAQFSRLPTGIRLRIGYSGGTVTGRSYWQKTDADGSTHPWGFEAWTRKFCSLLYNGARKREGRWENH